MSAKRFVLLVEMPLEKGWSAAGVEAGLQDAYGDPTIIVWGAVDGVDATYRKLLQLSRETEADASQSDRVHSAHKALSFFHDIWPASFWKWKRIGDRPSRDEQQMMAGR